MIRLMILLLVVVLNFVACEKILTDDYETAQAKRSVNEIETSSYLSSSEEAVLSSLKSSSSLIQYSSENENILSSKAVSSAEGLSSELVVVSSSQTLSSSGQVLSSEINMISSSNSLSSSVQISSSSFSLSYGSMTDNRNAQSYQTIKIGAQIWMAENLNYGSYVASMNSSSQYLDKAEKFCYENIESNCDDKGGLYQWHNVMGLDKECSDGTLNCVDSISSGNHQGICPVGWHVPKTAEWSLLETELGGANVAAKTMKLNDPQSSAWNLLAYNDGNSSGFSALGTGLRDYSGSFFSEGAKAYFWVAGGDSGNNFNAYYRQLLSDDEALISAYSSKRMGLSVRCLKD